MREHLARFFTALGYFTRLPVPAWVAWSPERLAHAAAWLPLVGWVIGLAGAAALHGLALVLGAQHTYQTAVHLLAHLEGDVFGRCRVEGQYGLHQLHAVDQLCLLGQGFGGTVDGL